MKKPKSKQHGMTESQSMVTMKAHFKNSVRILKSGHTAIYTHQELGV